MATLTYGGVNYTVHHAVAGGDNGMGMWDYVHGYDADNNLIVSIEGISDFSEVTYDGEYMRATDCMEEPCNDVKLCSGMLQTKGGKRIILPEMVALTVTGTFADSGVTVANAAGYDLYLVVVKTGGTNGSKSSVLIPGDMIPSSIDDAYAWNVSDADSSGIFKAYFNYADSTLKFWGTGYIGNGVAIEVPAVYGISFTKMGM